MMSPLLASVAPPTTTRPATCQAVACDAEPGDKAFATALDQAQAPARTQPEAIAKGDAKVDARADPQTDADAKTDPRADPRAEAKTGTKPGKAHMRAHPESETDVPGDEAAADSVGPSGLALLLPGWPAAPIATPHGQVAATPADAATGAPADADPSQAVLAGIADTSRRDGVALKALVPTQDPVPGATPAPVPNPTLEQRLPMTAAPTDHKALTTPGLPVAATEVATTVPARVSGDNALPAMLPLPAIAAPTAHPATGALTPTGPSFEARIAAAVDSPAFAPALASQLTWLVREGLQQARFSLNPLEMGPLAVKIVLDGTQARVDFSADMAGTRAAIEASLPTLAAALHDKGLTLAGGGVFDGQSRPGAQGERGHRAPSQPGGANAAATSAAAEPTAMPVRVGRGLVDLVA
jgi:flagellar hook-length control protein FliK